MSGRALLDAAHVWPWGERAVRRCLRRANALLAVSADARGDAPLAAEHVKAVLALPDDGGLEVDWASAWSYARDDRRPAVTRE